MCFNIQDVTGYAGYQWFLPSHYPDGWWDTDYYNSDMHEPTESVPCRTHEMALAVAGYMSLSRMSVAEGGQRVIGGLSATQWHERYQRELIHQVGSFWLNLFYFFLFPELQYEY